MFEVNLCKHPGHTRRSDQKPLTQDSTVRPGLLVCYLTVTCSGHYSFSAQEFLFKDQRQKVNRGSTIPWVMSASYKFIVRCHINISCWMHSSNLNISILSCQTFLSARTSKYHDLIFLHLRVLNSNSRTWYSWKNYIKPLIIRTWIVPLPSVELLNHLRYWIIGFK